MNPAAIRAQLVRDEGIRYFPYRDTVGKITIGVGRNLTDRGISAAEAKILLDNDIAACATELDDALPWWRGLDEPRQHVLVNMCFNLGIQGLTGFQRTLAHVQAGRWDEAAEAMLDSRWSRQVGQRAVRLAETMRTGLSSTAGSQTASKRS